MNQIVLLMALTATSGHHNKANCAPAPAPCVVVAPCPPPAPVVCVQAAPKCHKFKLPKLKLHGCKKAAPVCTTSAPVYEGGYAPTPSPQIAPSPQA